MKFSTYLNNVLCTNDAMKKDTINQGDRKFRINFSGMHTFHL